MPDGLGGDKGSDGNQRIKTAYFLNINPHTSEKTGQSDSVPGETSGLRITDVPSSRRIMVMRPRPSINIQAELQSNSDLM